MGGGTASTTGILRLLRMARILRMVRLFRMFTMLAILLSAFAKALSVVMWVGLLVVILDYIVAIVATQAVGHKADMWGEDAETVRQWFGTISQSMTSLFTVMTLAEWDDMAHILSHVMPTWI